MGRVAVALLMVFIASAAAVPARAKDCSDISSRVWSLSNFEPDPTAVKNNAGESPPTTTHATGAQIAAVAAAINLAPGRVKADLCNIDDFFVDTTDHGAWGRWENPLRHGGAPSKTEIVVNASDFGKKFHERQDDHLKQLKGENDQTLDNLAKHSEGTMSGGIDPAAYRLLYVLVHEMAHIRWHKASFTGDSPVCADDANFYSWKDIIGGTSRWTVFGADSGEYKNGSVKKPKHVQTAADLLAIYTGGFVTALAATSPEEDFVESYAIRALIEACPDCVTNIIIGTGGSATTIRVNNDRGDALLKAKFNCVHNKYIAPST